MTYWAAPSSLRSEDELAERVMRLVRIGGGVLSPLNCWLAARGLQSLSYRVRAHSENARQVACFLAEHPRIERVLYPHHPSHPQYELALRQMSVGSGLMSILVKGGRQAAIDLVNRLALFTSATSFGGTHSLIEHRESIEEGSQHAGQSAARVHRPGASGRLDCRPAAGAGMIYHIAKREAWTEAKARGSYRPPSLAAEGFIHCSRREQILSVADDFYRGQADLLLLCIDESRLTAELHWEAPAHPRSESAAATSGEAAFPHLYGPLNLDAVDRVYDFVEADDGFQLPTGLP